MLRECELHSLQPKHYRDQHLNLTLPSGTKFLQGVQNVTLVSQDSDDCGASVPNSSVSFNYSQAATSFSSQCTPVLNGTGATVGYYNCTFNTTGLSPQWYNVSVVWSNSPYYNYNSSAFTNSTLD